MLNASLNIQWTTVYLSFQNIYFMGNKRIISRISFQHFIIDSILRIATDDVDLQKSAAKLVPAMLVSVVVVVCYFFFGFNTVLYLRRKMKMHLTISDLSHCLSSSINILWLHYHTDCRLERT